MPEASLDLAHTLILSPSPCRPLPSPSSSTLPRQLGPAPLVLASLLDSQDTESNEGLGGEATLMSKTSPVWPAKAARDWPRMATEPGAAYGVSLSGYSLSLSSFSWASLFS